MRISRGGKAPHRFVVGRLCDALYKEIAPSHLFLSPVSAARRRRIVQGVRIFGHKNIPSLLP